MRVRLLLALFLGACASRGGPSYSVPAARPAPPPIVIGGTTVPAGARLEGDLNRPASTLRSSVGERLAVTLRSTVRRRIGRPLVRPGDQLVVRVAALEPGQGAKPARVLLEPVALRTRAGEVALRGRVVEARVVQRPDEPDTEPVRRGAIGGAVIGALFLNIPGALLGYGIGSSGGIASSLRARRIQGEVPAGAPIVVELTAPLDLAR